MSRSTEAGVRRRRVLGTACAGLVACAAAAAVLPIQVPREISSRTSLELSGITWSKTLSRYVVVSDDVDEGGAKHAPRLFTLSRDGRMDPTPVAIDGLDELNDPESIADGPGGTLFVCTSHSVNKHGHLPPSRRVLAQIALSPDRKAQLVGKVDLTTARSPGTDAPWTDARLDIEAIAFRAGALYIGLKAPLAPDGSATILKLADAAAVLKAGTVPPGALSVWSRSRFCVSHASVEACEGIADITFLADGSSLLVANSPKGMPSDGGGSLWKLAAPNGTPLLLKRFDGLKPEGITLSPDRSAAVLVFDRDGQKPLWFTWPLSS
jgi:hypothetical protein